MATVEEWIHALRYEVGTVEDPPNSNCQPYSHELGRPCESWCADFLAAIAIQVNLDVPSHSAYTPTLASAFKSIGRWSDHPEVGAYVFYDFPDRVYRVQHVEVVIAVFPDVIHTVGGNTSPDHHGSQDNGGGVYERIRPRDHSIVGYGLPKFSVAPAPAPPTTEEDDVPFIANPVTDNDPGLYFVVGNTYVPIATPDEKQQLENSGFHVHDLEPLAWSLFKATASEVAHP